jgi:hypothetical protein
VNNIFDKMVEWIRVENKERVRKGNEENSIWLAAILKL